MDQFNKVRTITTTTRNVSINDAQRMIVPKDNRDGLSSSDFFSGLFEQFDDIKKGDKIRVVGKDKFKGHVGTILRTYTTQHNQLVFSIELQSNGETIDRTKKNIKRCYT